MEKKYKLLALDLDGTLLTDDKKITLNTKETIYKAIESGVYVVFATGRGIQTANAFWKELGLNGPMVFVNGGEIWKGPGKLLKRNFIRKEDIKKLHQLAIDTNTWFWGYSAENLVHREEWTDEMFAQNWMKFGIRCENPTTLKEMWKTIESWRTLEVTQAAPINMEISLKGVTKETGIREVCKELEIDMGEVVAIGDSLNDLPLLRTAGLGVAMGNAVDAIKEAADVITDTNQNEGVAKAIEAYVIKNQVD
ncbi:phosphoglycolate phosphatase [Virgibacillus profundi]|uniref:Phosphoglycolate phosphatase n=1 Tax=Virgibacillus profundi TaxID=2024555 RepID=A0A2A2IGV2_9BACI|nr:Cof-type HAD-IIB family hydrolase [Virgibacillus profundi]PAV31231.1 phosphoglycolate phosphatase [Virgibacillus profundi]PXY55416.1 HAD family phosphatase [Virgibacillus profundi]